jgi:hypothetical protein
MADTPVTAEQFREQLGAEYGLYVAAQTIFIDGARAFNAGDPVPVAHVERGVVASDEVKKVSTKAGQALVSGSTTESKG